MWRRAGRRDRDGKSAEKWYRVRQLWRRRRGMGRKVKEWDREGQEEVERGGKRTGMGRLQKKWYKCERPKWRCERRGKWEGRRRNGIREGQG